MQHICKDADGLARKKRGRVEERERNQYEREEREEVKLCE